MNYDVAVIGGGPAAASVCDPLVKKGLRVLSVRPPPRISSSPSSPTEEITIIDPKVSPKWQLAHVREDFEAFKKHYRIVTDNFKLAGSLSEGGLSRYWGAGVAKLTPHDMADWPLARGDLENAYRSVQARIGVSGPQEPGEGRNVAEDLHPPPPLCPAAERLMAAYLRIRPTRLTLSRPLQAVITRPMGAREACDLSGHCMTGCARRSIYDASFTWDELASRPNLVTCGGMAEGFYHTGASWKIVATAPGGDAMEHEATLLILACGTIATTILLMRNIPHFPKTKRLYSHPAAGFAAFLPRVSGAANARKTFGLTQLSFLAEAAGGTPLSGNLFAGASVPADVLAQYVLLPRPIGKWLFSRLQQRLLLANCLLDSRYSDHRIALHANGTATIQGGASAEVPALLHLHKQRLVRTFLKLGAIILPGSFKAAAPGADAHYHGTAPMRRNPGAGECDNMGRLHGTDRLFLVDGASIPSIGCTPPTLTVMANAHRIGTAIVEHFAGGE